MGGIIIKKLVYLLSLIILSFGAFLAFNLNNVRAISEYSGLSENASLYKLLSDDDHVPNGLSDVSQWFDIANLNNGTNNAKLLPPNSGSNFTSRNVIEITDKDKTGSFGAVWSNRDASDKANQNYIDINKKQTMSMWLLFGGGRLSGSYADGMAFVLQGQGPNAFNHQLVSGAPVGGETMGVWGIPLRTTVEEMANSAIQKSWALEFDTKFNGDGSVDSSYDAPLRSYQDSSQVITEINHIADGYPGDASSYTFSTEDYPELNHNNPTFSYYKDKSDKNSVVRNFLTDQQWHHLTITWTPESMTSTGNPTVNYKFNDETLDGEPKTPDIEKNINIDLSKMHLDGLTKLYWGFTGSTGQDTETNLVVFESVPSIVEADTTSKLFDITQADGNGNPREVGDSGKVNNGDKLSLEYDLKYLSGSQDWKSIAADIDLPTNITYSGGQITYTDGTTQNLSVNGDSTNVTTTLSKDISSTNKLAKITFTGTAKADDNTVSTPVASQHASFIGTNLQKNVMSPAFTIVQPKTLTLTANSEDNQKIQISGQTNLGGIVAYKPTDTLDDSKITIHRIINGSETPDSSDAPLLGTLNSDSSADTFSYNVLAKDLTEGKNTVSFYAEDENFNKSNIISYTVNVVGDLIVNAAQTSHFQTVQEYPTNRMIHRSKDWSLTVNDQRSKNSSWTLQAQATSLSNGSQTWDNGGIIFVDKDGNIYPLTNKVANIANGTKSQDAEQQFDIDDSWGHDNGILLQQSGIEPTGTYTSTITWTAIDGIENIS